jgi:hypothetical protein
MEFSLINIATLVAYVALATDFTIEIHRVWKRRHGDDISAIGTTIRTLAAGVVLVKLSFVGDQVLIFGQAIMVVLLCTYLVLVFHYRSRL